MYCLLLSSCASTLKCHLQKKKIPTDDILKAKKTDVYMCMIPLVRKYTRQGREEKIHNVETLFITRLQKNYKVFCIINEKQMRYTQYNNRHH